MALLFELSITINSSFDGADRGSECDLVAAWHESFDRIDSPALFYSSLSILIVNKSKFLYII